MQNHVANPLTLIANPYTKVCGSYVRLYWGRNYTILKKVGQQSAPLSMHFSTRLMCKNVWLVNGNSSSRTMPVNQRGARFMGVSLEVIGPGVGTTLKKTKLVLHSISLVSVLESEYNSWSCCSCDNFEGIITSGNNDLARKTGWFQSRVLVCISMVLTKILIFMVVCLVCLYV